MYYVYVCLWDVWTQGCIKQMPRGAGCAETKTMAAVGPVCVLSCCRTGGTKVRRHSCSTLIQRDLRGGTRGWGGGTHATHTHMTNVVSTHIHTLAAPGTHGLLSAVRHGHVPFQSASRLLLLLLIVLKVLILIQKHPENESLIQVSIIGRNV